MIAVIQRVSQAHVTVENKIVGRIGPGLVILLGVFQNDGDADAAFLADKIAGLRIFGDEQQKMNLSIKDVGGAALVISQFTLCGDWRKGRRPSFISAADPETGRRLYEKFIADLKIAGVPTEQGIFGAMMAVSLVNDGPVTFVLDSKLR
ncbi:MAG: D-tyrosyl-tRNA(Tyr) deacylase [Candidatus Marinimicrobia bacterium]|jgi:D-tyrosyl-tRNA(Tyr) deacylase|nr:D-tyrosyl-tRNA(Tyr) deacylase [Candidatus Neomarinimicrobiota bacterium]HNZ36135.1 D-aminoacyl-tRNA deacylase [Candidatus Neomarinimicrobiota bacterium]HOU17065.1 D-aminoacyl-tRNA deacylase [Candidatus Neomarinimicrobiota bacterium]HOV24352.1 D-aminoacyl-tRNA deacylase [Candidatus Neomarinimicrobiota bacterium]HPB00462.1 D-aminoacyl-tRNA deacylase [Candidatus Neomarinimicrobiota bacterium]